MKQEPKPTKRTFKHYFTEECEPKRCTNCEGTSIVSIVKDTINYVSCEKEAVCSDCGTVVGYWSYGFWDPDYAKDFVEGLQDS